MANGYKDGELQDARKEIFLGAYAAEGVIQPACLAADISRTTYRRWRKDDDAFSAGCDDALQAAIDAGERELRRRGVDGVEEHLTYKGEPIWRRDPDTGDLLLDDDFNPVPFTVRRQSDRLLEVYVRSHRPIYKEKSALELSGPGGGAIPSALTIRFVESDGEGGIDPLGD